MFGIFMNWFNRGKKKMNTNDKVGMEVATERPKPLQPGEKRVTNYGADGKPLVGIEVVVERPCFGQAQSYYRLNAYTKTGHTHEVERFNFQRRPLADGIYGLTNEAAVALVKDRLLGYQSGPTPSPFNEEAIRGLEIFEKAMADRAAARNASGLRGTHAVDTAVQDAVGDEVEAKPEPKAGIDA